MGSVVVSVDAELGWGFHDQRSPPSDRARAGRNGWRRLLDLFDEHEIPATWAVVGHLFLSSCDRRHREIPAPMGWFHSEQNGLLADPELRYAPELVGATVNADVDHDVGIHTFSHVQFGSLETSTALARAEVDAAVEVARRAGIDPVSFVFPRNDIGHLDVLAESPIECYRGHRPDQRGEVSQKLGKFRDATIGPRTPTLVEPSVDGNGLVNVPASLFLYGFEGLTRTLAATVREDPVVAKVRRGLEAASSSDGILHLWLHPNNLVSRRHVDRMARICELVGDYSDRGEVSIRTMRDVAEQARQRGPTPTTGD
ncbi:polysaccharide deacetylase family protein [Haloarchaeobius sp. HRN-SO-5]|uniref:polysaccharide deacetylase family protein n=1 Tax=Haloarchaeobius sp. HRN-SO-5 TaxID=3446118 RepID=UPI003EB91AF4